MISKSLDGGLSAAEDARLNQLAGDRALAAGLIEPEDLKAERANATAATAPPPAPETTQTEDL